MLLPNKWRKGELPCLQNNINSAKNRPKNSQKNKKIKQQLFDNFLRMFRTNPPPTNQEIAQNVV